MLQTQGQRLGSRRGLEGTSPLQVGVATRAPPPSHAGGASLPSSLLGTAPEVETAEPTAPPLQDMEWVLPSRIGQGTRYSQGAS